MKCYNCKTKDAQPDSYYCGDECKNEYRSEQDKKIAKAKGSAYLNQEVVKQRAEHLRQEFSKNGLIDNTPEEDPLTTKVTGPEHHRDSVYPCTIDQLITLKILFKENYENR